MRIPPVHAMLWMKKTPEESRSKLEMSRDILSRPPAGARVRGRIKAIDLARGIAVALMILSHGVNGMMAMDQLPRLGLIPIHLITKFSSSLFIIVFGVALTIAVLPNVHSEGWPRRRTKMILNGLVIFFWYKVLTIFEMLYLAEPEQILNTLLFGAFPCYVEHLGFYAIALLWAPFLVSLCSPLFGAFPSYVVSLGFYAIALLWGPFLVSLWSRTPLWLRLASPVLLGLFALWLSYNFHCWGNSTIQALLVEHEDYYTWGQLTRGPLVLTGLLIGEVIVRYHAKIRDRLRVSGGLLLAAILLFAALLILAGPDLSSHLEAIAMNEGKHPPGLLFMLFSVAGALAILALCLAGGDTLATLLHPLTVIGTDALKAFIFHIFVIFVIFRYLFGFYHNISYTFALILTLLLIPATALWISVTRWIDQKRS